MDQVRLAVRPGGHVLVATFAHDGPSRCSGLQVSRYTPDVLHGEFGDEFQLVGSTREDYVTPQEASGLHRLPVPLRARESGAGSKATIHAVTGS